MKMKKKLLLLPVFAALYLILSSPLLVSAATTATQSKARGAYAYWGGGTEVYVQAGNTEFTLPYPPYSNLGKIFIWGWGPGLGFIAKELTINEFSWNLVSCRVSTEIDGNTLVIEWVAYPSIYTYYYNPSPGPINVIQNTIWKVASATLWYGQIVLVGGVGTISGEMTVELTGT